MSQDWDVDSYKTEYENEEHWQLRRNFMLAHKDKFSEDEIVCLAQVFTNIELMGCRYPDQTMIRIAELAKGVVEKFREKKKNSLKRTFVAASDAASSKVKREVSKKETEGPPNKIKKTDSEQSLKTMKGMQNAGIISNDDDDDNKTNANNSKQGVRTSKYGGVKTFSINSNIQPVLSSHSQPKEQKLAGPLGEFVLFYSDDENSINKISRSASINKLSIRWDYEEEKDGLKGCKLFINNQFIASGLGENVKQSKEHAATAALNKLSESYFGVKVKSKFFSDTTIDASYFKTHSMPGKKLNEDGIGGKLMKLMGWRGGGLGSKEQGIEEPITAPLHVRRDGFGQIKNNKNIKDFTKKARAYIRTWMESNSEQDLIFSSDFSIEERKILHEIASQYLLKSKSYGKDNNRQLVISRKVVPWEIVEELKKSGGSSGKYELLEPKSTFKV